MKRAAGLALILLWIPGPVRAAETFPLPPMAPVERGEYVALDAKTGAKLWQVSWTLDKTFQDGRTTVRVVEEGEGVMGTKTPTKWTVHMHLQISPGDARFSSTRDVRDPSGQPLEVQERELDYTAGSGRITIRNARTGATETQSLSLPPQAIGVEILAVELRVLPEEPGRQMRFVLVTIDGKKVGMLARIVGRQRVNVPAGSFDCYKVELSPTGIAGVVADLVLPKMYMWYTVAAPHIWVKYEGPGAGVGSPEIVRQLVRFSPLPALSGAAPGARPS